MIIMHPTEGELNLGAEVGKLRHIWALRRGCEHRHGRNQVGGFEHHINGAIGEMMFAKYRNIFWSGTVGTTKAAADVGPCYQVRATDHPAGKLTVYSDDNDNQPFVLVRLRLPEVQLVGWLWGAEAKSAEFWRADMRAPAFFAWPLHDMETLPTEAEIAERNRKAS